MKICISFKWLLCMVVVLWGSLGICIAQEISQPPFVVDEHTVLLLHFDEGVGDIVNDASSYGNNGEANYVKWTKKGKFGDAIAFNGYMNVCIPDNDSLDLTNDFTVEAWIYLDGKESIYNRRLIMGKSNFQIQHYRKGTFYFCVQSEVNKLYVVVENKGDAFALESDEVLLAGNFYHVGFSFKDGVLKLLIDGKVVKSGIAPFKILTNEEFAEDDIYIGNNDTALAPFCGIIDEIRVSNSARY